MCCVCDTAFFLPLFGCFCGKTKCRRDTAIKAGENAFHLEYDSSSAIVLMSVVSYLAAGFLVLELLTHGVDPAIRWTYRGCGFILAIFIIVAAIGKRYLVIDKINNNLEMSISGCCSLIHRRILIGSISDIHGFGSKGASVYMGYEQPINLVVGFKDINKKDVKIMGPHEPDVISDWIIKVEHWWFKMNVSSNDIVSPQSLCQNRYISRSELYQQQPQINMNTYTNTFSLQFKVFLLMLKVKEPEKEKVIDIAYELDEDKMIEEYVIIKSMTSDVNLMIDLLLNKANTIIGLFQVRKMAIDSNVNGFQAFSIYKQFDRGVGAMNVLLYDLYYVQRGREFAAYWDKLQIWSVLGRSQLDSDLT